MRIRTALAAALLASLVPFAWAESSSATEERLALAAQPSSIQGGAPGSPTESATGPMPAGAVLPDAALPPDTAAAPEAGPDIAAPLPPPELPAIDYGIDIPWDEPAFQSFRSAYLSEGGRKWLEAILARAEPFLPFIAERVRFYNLPDALAWLPVIESEFSPRAVSRSGAVGLWQFMKNSIGGYGIRVDDWVDERRDFMKSTDAALRKLQYNHSKYDDWNLALAAYNMGDGAVSRAVKKAAAEPGAPARIDYWYLRKKGYLSAETTSYVPKFLAVVSILACPARNGLSLSWKEPASWEIVETAKSVDLGLLAEAAKVDVAVLKAANPELRYTVTPPWKGYGIKVPAGEAEAVRAALEDPALKLLRYYMHTVRSGDTLSAIARHYGIPMDLIVQANPGLKPSLLRIGQVIVVPALKDVGPMPQAAHDEDAALDFSGTYAVQKGDSLWSISLKYEVQPEVLADKNGLTLTSVIREGMSLRVPILKQ